MEVWNVNLWLLAHEYCKKRTQYGRMLVDDSLIEKEEKIKFYKRYDDWEKSHIKILQQMNKKDLLELVK